MLKHRLTDRICCLALAATLALTALLMGASALGIVEENHTIGYEARLFDQSRVHTIDIAVDDWEGFLETCADEEFVACSVVIDGESYKNVGLRAKGNTSLSSVAAYGNNRYSFKIEFDQYKTGGSYYGLDKLSLNNMIQDNTYLKDYLAYALMGKMGVAAPLCSFAYITVNGEDWGLYLAVEAVEDSFLQRNYGSDHGELYKPDSMSIGGGRGNGRDFDFSAFAGEDGESASFPDMGNLQPPEGFDPSTLPKAGEMPSGGFGPSSPPEAGEMPFGDFDPSQMMGGIGGAGSEDTKLQYIDDDPESYANIFNSAKTDITLADRKRLISSLKVLSEGGNTSSAVDAEAVIRYLAVHNFLCNDDSYTGMLVHNYYLYEEDGRLSLIPWDYNLAFGGFTMGGMGTSSEATATINAPIDSPVSSGSIESRPMISWIFESEENTALYHRTYAEFVDAIFTSGWFEETLDAVAAMIAPYVEKDPTAFCTYEEFETGVAALDEFCNLRAESVSGQLNGSIPSTAAGQSADDSSLVDGSAITLSDMGSFSGGGGPGMAFPGSTGSADGNMPSMGGFGFPAGGLPRGGVPADDSSDSAAMARVEGSSENTASDMGAHSAGSSWILLTICIAVLIAGIAIAGRFKHNL